MNDSWASAGAYERFMGRWSTPIAQKFLRWLAVPDSRSWLDVGCGTGCLTRLILEAPQPKAAILKMLRVTKAGGKIGIFLWDYAEGMQMLRYFWNAAVELDHKASEVDEGRRFSLCRAGQLQALAREAGLKQVEATAIEVATIFQSFDDYWEPFLGNVGPAPGYAMGLAQGERQKLEDKLRKSLPIDDNGSIALLARAWAVRGVE